eukprot:m.435404 g.435404  ORF g.435404 m.435404 type:complete len:308 (+) comp17844_c0_seq1:61-984(+)
MPAGASDDNPRAAKRSRVAEGEEDPHFGADSVSFDKTKVVADFLETKTKHRPTVLIVCGSGLGGLADDIEDKEEIPYGEIPGFATSTVAGHKGQLVFGNLGGKCVVAMQGRIHMYEGQPLWRATMPIRVLRHMGATHMVVTNACGGINPKLKEGDIMLMSDHINCPGMAGFHPLRGPNDDKFGPRFPPMNQAYDKEIRELARKGYTELGIPQQEGTYAFVCGPSYETPAEIKMLGLMGADVVGMSTVPEVIVASHCGMKVLGLSLVTNVCITVVDSVDAPNHEEVKEMANKRAADMRSLVAYVVERF